MARETDRAEGGRIAPARRAFTDTTGMIDTPTVVRILDLVGTFVFAISGAVAAVNGRLDIFGILVLSFVAGNFGGIGRDVLIGAVPPGALTDVRYLLVSVLAGVITFFRYAGVDRLRNPVLLFDAAGLSDDRHGAVLLPLLCHHCGRFMRPSRKRADRPWREISTRSNCPPPGSS